MLIAPELNNLGFLDGKTQRTCHENKSAAFWFGIVESKRNDCAMQMKRFFKTPHVETMDSAFTFPSSATDSIRPVAVPSPVAACRKGKFLASDDQRTSENNSLDTLRFRLQKFGTNSLLDTELLELLLFDSLYEPSPNRSVCQLFAEFGGLNEVLFASEHRIRKETELSRNSFLKLQLIKAIALRMAKSKVLKRHVLSCWDDLLDYCRTSMSHKVTEHFRVFYLDRKNAVIAEEEQGKGTVDHVPVYPRELAKRALELSASSIILVHNHPSGDPSPSQEDVEMTRKIALACETIGVTVHDHVIVGKSEVFSFKTNQLF